MESLVEHFEQKIRKISLGQKISPLNILEVQNPFNIRYKPWREFLISEKVQDLIINGICKGFPFIGDYYYIKDRPLPPLS